MFIKLKKNRFMLTYIMNHKYFLLVRKMDELTTFLNSVSLG